MICDVLIEAPEWEPIGLPALAERAAEASLRHLGLDPAQYEIAILACDDARIAQLNADFRGKPAPTNVLSWPAADLTPPEMPAPGELGDIAIACGTCAREAAEQGKSLSDHVTHLIVHATLHLLGYDHQSDAEATAMEALEVAILETLGVADPY